MRAGRAIAESVGADAEVFARRVLVEYWNAKLELMLLFVAVRRRPAAVRLHRRVLRKRP